MLRGAYIGPWKSDFEIFSISSCICDLPVVPCFHHFVRYRKANCDVEHVLCLCESKVPVEHRQKIRAQRLEVTEVATEAQRKEIEEAIEESRINEERVEEMEVILSSQPDSLFSSSQPLSVGGISSAGSLYDPVDAASGPSNLIKYPCLAMELIRIGTSSRDGAAIANAMLHDLKPYLRDDTQDVFENLMLDLRKLDHAKKAVGIDCTDSAIHSNATRSSPIVCIGVDGRKDETLAYETVTSAGDGVLPQTKTEECHLAVTDESAKLVKYLSHCTLPIEGKNVIQHLKVYFKTTILLR